MICLQIAHLGRWTSINLSYLDGKIKGFHVFWPKAVVDFYRVQADDGSVVAGTYTTVEWGSLGNCRWRPSSVIKGGKGKSMEIIYEWRFVAGHLYTIYAGKMGFSLLCLTTRSVNSKNHVGLSKHQRDNHPTCSCYVSNDHPRNFCLWVL